MFWKILQHAFVVVFILLMFTTIHDYTPALGPIAALGLVILASMKIMDWIRK